jgi:hypothetical protein
MALSSITSLTAGRGSNSGVGEFGIGARFGAYLVHPKESRMSSVIAPKTEEVAASSFYRVTEEIRDEAYCKCQACVMWTIVFQENGEEVEIGQSWQGVLGHDAAQDICDLMNMAYDAGCESNPEAK